MRAEEADTPAIQAEGLTRHFGTITALEGVTLTVPKGTVFGFLGPNGAGKTTTIRLLLGLLPPTAGRLRVLGHLLPDDALAVRRRTGVVLEQHGFYEGLTVAASLSFAARAYGLSVEEARSQVIELAGRMGLGERLDSRPQTLSRGLRQRLAITRALVGRPELLVLDEPTNGLDAGAAADLRALLVDLVADGATVFLTTHLLSEAERLCDLVSVIKDGRLVATGAPAQLRRQAAIRHVRIEGPRLAERLAATTDPAVGRWHWEADGADVATVAVDDLTEVPAVVAALVRLGAPIHRVEPVGQTLEAAFLSLVADRPETPDIVEVTT